VEYLLDTHTLLWALGEPEKLGASVRRILESEERVLLSPVSAFEIAQKHRVGKMPEAEALVDNYDEVIAPFRFTELPLRQGAALFAGKLQWSHRDPFDRMLAAQAYLANATLMTNDRVFQQLPWLRTIWD
jgi:PIN domain nuclease of toxin-antitoxin system